MLKSRLKSHDYRKLYKEVMCGRLTLNVTEINPFLNLTCNCIRVSISHNGNINIFVNTLQMEESILTIPQTERQMSTWHESFILLLQAHNLCAQYVYILYIVLYCSSRMPQCHVCGWVLCSSKDTGRFVVKSLVYYKSLNDMTEHMVSPSMLALPECVCVCWWLN